MADSPTTTNQAATVADKVLHALIFDVAVNAAEAAIISAAPLMDAPVLKQIDEMVIKFVAGKIYDALAKGTTFAIIDAQTSTEAANANSTEAALKIALAGGNNDAIEKTTQDFKDAFEKLVHLDGSARP